MAFQSITPLVAYRHLLRATRVAFWGDWPRLHAARDLARQKFEAEKNNTTEQESKIQEAMEAAKILRTSIVQAEKVEGTDDTYRLNIHSGIERGDNDSVKVAGKKVKVDKCCSS